MLYDAQLRGIPLNGIKESDLPPGESYPAIVPVGTRVLVLADDGPDDKEPKIRKVRISVKEGRFIGMVGTVPRMFLRPVPR